MSGWSPSARFDEAVRYAIELHRDQRRKGGGIPYLSHLFSVAALVMEDGGDEEEAIAALLHDAVEDAGGRPTLEEIRRRFGRRVARIVEGCSDTDEIPKPPWSERKRGYLARLAREPEEVRRVALADKLHNARTLLADQRARGDAHWERFNAPKADQLWYYDALIKAFERTGTRSGHLEELKRVVAELKSASPPP